jgi:hypothetical protein
MSDLPADFWLDALPYARGGEAIFKEAMLTIVLTARPDADEAVTELEELASNSKPVSLVTFAAAVGRDAAGRGVEGMAGAASSKRHHVYLVCLSVCLCLFSVSVSVCLCVCGSVRSV